MFKSRTSAPLCKKEVSFCGLYFILLYSLLFSSFFLLQKFVQVAATVYSYLVRVQIVRMRFHALDVQTTRSEGGENRPYAYRQTRRLECRYRGLRASNLKINRAAHQKVSTRQNVDYSSATLVSCPLVFFFSFFQRNLKSNQKPSSTVRPFFAKHCRSRFSNASGILDQSSSSTYSYSHREWICSSLK